MLYGVYEFEVISDGDGWFVALPYDLEGGTQGHGFDDLCRMVADWLRVTLEDYDMHDRPLPAPTYGNEPRHGGRNMVFGACAGRETVSKVSASEAAGLLGVTPGRVSQMISEGLMDGWREGRNTWVAVDSVRARLDKRREAPARELAPA